MTILRYSGYIVELMHDRELFRAWVSNRERLVVGYATSITDDKTAILMAFANAKQTSQTEEDWEDLVELQKEYQNPTRAYASADITSE